MGSKHVTYSFHRQDRDNKLMQLIFFNFFFQMILNAVYNVDNCYQNRNKRTNRVKDWINLIWSYY